MRIFHVALAADWLAAQSEGSYAVSTRDVTLAEQGFIHASRADQWQQIVDLFYDDLRAEILLLEIDTDRLTAPWREEEVAGTTFPHIYGPLNLDAVVATVRPSSSAR